MTLYNKLLLCVVMFVIPFFVGGLPVWFVDRNHRKLRKELNIGFYFKLLIQAWIYGNISMFAVMQLIAIPMISLKMKFTPLARVFCVLCAFLAIVGAICWIFTIKRVISQMKADGFFKKRNPFINKKKLALAVLGIGFAAMVLIQARVAAKYQHTDDDDARFVALELIAVENDRMLDRNTINGDPWYWNVGEVKKDYTSPWVMYVACVSYVTGIHPAILSHRMLPMFLIPLCYAAYLALGLKIFKDDWGRALLFSFLLSVFFLTGYLSRHTVAAMMLLRIWQGKALFASFVIPVELLLLWEIYDNPEVHLNKWLLVLTCEAACLLSGSGIVISAVMVGIYGLFELVRNKRFWRAASVWATCAPCVLYALCNVFWYQIFMQMK